MNSFFRSMLVGLVVMSASQAFAEPFELKDGDKVVWLGSTLIEREQRYGYWETALTARWPHRNITFRNLGWSGDNVYGEARLAFDITNPALGLKRMVDLTLAEKPTVIFICYGTNESFEGEAGLEKFEKGLEKLLDELKPAKARIVLMTPIGFALSTAAKTDIDQVIHKNGGLSRYCKIIKAVAKRHSLHCADLFKAGTEAFQFGPQTENGMHLTREGYSDYLGKLRDWLEINPVNFSIEIANGKIAVESVPIKIIPGATLKFDAEFAALPDKYLATLSGPTDHLIHLRVKDLAEGTYALLIDGNEATRATKDQWAIGWLVPKGPEVEQVEQLRQAIIEKNQLYFYRWRPQNETYLFGFRKHEQGKNAKEVAEYDPLIAAKEKEIAKLRVPKTHRYEIVPVEKK